MLGSICELMSCRASDLVLDDRPDAWLRFEIDLAVTRFWSWFKAKMNETRKDGKKTVPKYTVEQLLEDDHPDEESNLWLPPSVRSKQRQNPQSLVRGSGEGRVLTPGEAYP